MKYVMFTHRKHGLKVPAFASDSVCHCDIKIGRGWVPTSAGSFDIKSQSCSGHSDTLGLSPDPGDEKLCILVLGGLESMLWMAQDPEENLRNLRRSRPKQPVTIQVTSAAKGIVPYSPPIKVTQDESRGS